MLNIDTHMWNIYNSHVTYHQEKIKQEIQSENGLAGSTSTKIPKQASFPLQQLEGHFGIPCPGDLRCLPSSGIGGGVRVLVVSGWSGVWWAIDDERTANNTRKPRRWRERIVDLDLIFRFVCFGEWEGYDGYRLYAHFIQRPADDTSVSKLSGSLLRRGTNWFIEAWAVATDFDIMTLGSIWPPNWISGFILGDQKSDDITPQNLHFS